jgi:formamidopyrimidine-DNA glycosylase
MMTMLGKRMRKVRRRSKHMTRQLNLQDQGQRVIVTHR